MNFAAEAVQRLGATLHRRDTDPQARMLRLRRRVRERDVHNGSLGALHLHERGGADDYHADVGDNGRSPHGHRYGDSGCKRQLCLAQRTPSPTRQAPSQLGGTSSGQAAHSADPCRPPHERHGQHARKQRRVGSPPVEQGPHQPTLPHCIDGRSLDQPPEGGCRRARTATQRSPSPLQRLRALRPRLRGPHHPDPPAAVEGSHGHCPQRRPAHEPCRDGRLCDRPSPHDRGSVHGPPRGLAEPSNHESSPNVDDSFDCRPCNFASDEPHGTAGIGGAAAPVSQTQLCTHRRPRSASADAQPLPTRRRRDTLASVAPARAADGAPAADADNASDASSTANATAAEAPPPAAAAIGLPATRAELIARLRRANPVYSAAATRHVAVSDQRRHCGRPWPCGSA